MIIGIDPGLDGAVCFYNEESHSIHYEILPTYKLKAKGKTKSGKERCQRRKRCCRLGTSNPLLCSASL